MVRLAPWPFESADTGSAKPPTVELNGDWNADKMEGSIVLSSGGFR